MKLNSTVANSMLKYKNKDARWLADRLKMTPWYIKKLTAGKVSCSDRTIKQIAKLLDCNWKEIAK